MEFRVKISSAVVIICDSGAWFAFNWPLQVSHKFAKLLADSNDSVPRKKWLASEEFAQCNVRNTQWHPESSAHCIDGVA